MDETALKEYKQETLRQMKRAFTSFCFLAIVFFPLFGFLDYYAHYPQVERLWTIRGATTALFVLFFILFTKTSLKQKPLAGSLCVLFTATISVTLMAMTMGIYDSPYYAGVNLVILAASLLTPWEGAKLAGLNASLVMVYVLGYFYQAGSATFSSEPFLNNIFFLFSTAGIGSIGGHIRERSRRLLFLSYREKAQMEAGKAKAEQAMELRDEFISIASHELKTPLTVLKARAEMIEMALGQEKLNSSQEVILKAVSTFGSSIHNLSRLIDDMADVANKEGKSFEMRIDRVDLAEIVARVVKNFEMTQKAVINFSTEESIQGKWDSFRIEQVVNNLLSNSVKYGNGLPVNITLKRENETAVLIVEDKGPGIDSKYHASIFDRYERAPSEQNISGLGLGLYISRQIIEAHQGEIMVQSEPGKGSTFKVVLPSNE